MANIDYDALFRISYGLYIVCSGDQASGNGFISNTVFQVTSSPPQFGACCNKDNLTAGFIAKYGAFSVSILKQEASQDIIKQFGYQSGRTANKLRGLDVIYGKTGVPVVRNASLAYLECRVVQTFDVGTHLIFIGELVESVMFDPTAEPMTYAFYRNNRKASAPANAPTYVDPAKLVSKKEPADAPRVDAQGRKWKQYQCTVCSYIYDEEKEGVRFEDLPDDWVCPDCGSEKSVFIEI
jgi:flavin reductase (DIM6/NTAB) family NADH-FMN oxidoreductase RutF/rubredoxin